MGVRWGIHPDLDAGGHRCVCWCCWSRSFSRTRRPLHTHYRSHRRNDPAARRDLSVLAAEGRVPREVPDANDVHHDLVAGWDWWSDPDGHCPRHLLPGLLLALVPHSISTRHYECRGHGPCHTSDFCREDATRRPSYRPGGRRCACSLWHHGTGSAGGTSDEWRRGQHAYVYVRLDPRNAGQRKRCPWHAFPSLTAWNT